ncbi:MULTISPECIES: hypothetical protein [unclassified Marinimicrobium]|jgi:hypothetical protein|uniref:hypothetical protein n=1 Tax=Marinimicrobium TaxID=359337 RepID=UPI000C616DF1|nr:MULTISPECIES: hypothetical protein [unclassified Marinimicrobium]MAN52111.1 hypothetical protein [Marinimicrobium sp.]
MIRRFLSLILVSSLTLLVGCDSNTTNDRSPAETNTIEFAADAVQQGGVNAQDYLHAGEAYNREAPIPSQCYTKTDGRHNPCYTCHQTYGDRRPNQMHDGFLQGSYAFSEFGERNHWQNLFKDRRPYIEQVSDEAIIEYVHQDNYTDLIQWMRSDQWSGEEAIIEDLHRGADAFDEHGLAKDGSRWVAFNYKPLPSTFWPTNGSTDDVMIRLPAAFSEIDGQFSRDVYFANLSLLEMAVTGTQELDTPPLNEAALDIDLDGDGVLSVASHRIRHRPFYLGDASEVPLTHMLYPEGTAFLHTVRYLGVDDSGRIYNAPRMKEVRYMVKDRFRPATSLTSSYYMEAKEKHFGNLPGVADHADRGMDNKFGWRLWGFIEDAQGTLRKQHHEEQFFCMGCHKSVGTSIDHTFAFPRKVAGADGWGYIDLTTQQDTPSLGEYEGEFLQYLERVGGGDEFRQNEEMLERWFHPDGRVNREKVTSVRNLYELITPSRERALALNKAYRAIVEEQSYIFGRDATIKPATNVFQSVDPSTPPLEPEHRHQWDIRLAWPDTSTEDYWSWQE